MPKIMVRGPDGKLRYVEADDHNVPVGRKDRVETGGTRKPPPRREVPEDQRVSGARERAKLTRQVMVQSNPAYGIANMLGGDYGVDLAERFGRGAIFGLDTRLGAAARASKEFITGENRNFRENYAQELEAQKKLAAEREQRTGTVGDVVEFAGGMAVPMGTGARVVQGANALRVARGAKPLGRVAQTALAGATVGGTAGSIEGAARSEDFGNVGDVAANTVRGGLTGAAAGTVLGPAAAAAGGAARRGINALRRGTQRGIRPNPNAREAMEEGLQETANLINERGRSVPALEREMGELREQGIQPIVADVTRGTEGRLRAVSDLGADVSTARQKLVERADTAGQRMREQISEASGVDPAFQARQAQRERIGERRARGRQQYEPGGEMEAPVQLTEELERVLRTRAQPGNPRDTTFREMYNDAVTAIRSDPNIAHTVDNIDLSGDPLHQPNTLRVMDRVMRQYRQRVDQLYRSNQGDQAEALRNQWDALRGVLGQTNPQYREILADQARGFATERAATLADQLGPMVISDPRRVIDELSQIPHGEDQEAMRQAFVSWMFDKSGRHPLQLMRSIRAATSERAAPEGRQLWEFILNGEQGVRQVRRAIRREERGSRVLSALGNSQTSRFAADQGRAQSEDAAVAAARALAGVGTGNPAMAAGGAAQWMRLMWKKAVDPISDAGRSAQAKVLSRNLEPGDIQRIQEQGRQAYGRSMRRRTRTGSRGARAGATGVNYLTKPVTYYDARDDEQ